MVLQCGASVAALPEHEEMIFIASVEVSGVGLVGSRLLRALWLILVAAEGIYIIGGLIPHPCDYAPKFSRFYIGVILPSSYPIPPRQNKARESLFHSPPHGLTYHLRRQAQNLPRFRASQPHSSNKDGGAGSGMIENSTLGR